MQACMIHLVTLLYTLQQKESIIICEVIVVEKKKIYFGFPDNLYMVYGFTLEDGTEVVNTYKSQEVKHG